MSGKQYWDGEWPNLNSISISIFAPELSPAEFGALYRLVWFVASREVHSAYSEPESRGYVPTGLEMICRIVGCSEGEWSKISAQVLQHFKKTQLGYDLIDRSVIRHLRPGRTAVPVATSRVAADRDGRMCVYCGDAEGPFDLDHLWPVSKGGSNDPSNIVIACASCNLSKGDKTLHEWKVQQQ